jgi:glycerol-3-phosphate dehydrogenase
VANECVDLLIIGGGINGVGIARDAAGRGLKVTLVEQADLASATSSASTKLIHGGLRYLEFFEFRLVREALIERERLLAIAPHLIRPMQFILPHVPGLRPRWQIRLGLFLYDHLGGRRRLPASRAVRIGAGRYAPLHPGLEYGFAYSDCWVDDSRLVVLNALDAAERGAAIHTRTHFMSATVDAGGDAGRPCWQVHCEVSHGGPLQLRARAIVNAAGPWVDQVEQRLPIARDQIKVRLVKGSHILLPRLFDGDHAFMLQNPDGRIVFAIPYGHESTLVGTTDIPFQGDPADVRISAEEVDYLCATVNRYFQHAVSPEDVRWSYAGVRPLSDDEATNVSKVTRDYRLELTEADSHPPVLLVYGGKITTYRRLAESALARLIPRLESAARSAPAGHDAAAASAGQPRSDATRAANGRRNGIGPAWTDTIALPGGDLPNADFDAFLSRFRQRWPFLPTDVSHRLARAYGARAERFLGRARSMAELGESFGAGLTRAEVDYLIAHEWARSADDVLWRRSKLGLYLSPRQSERLAEVMTASMKP